MNSVLISYAKRTLVISGLAAVLALGTAFGQ
jgi:hypothetical protein